MPAGGVWDSGGPHGPTRRSGQLWHHPRTFPTFEQLVRQPPPPHGFSEQNNTSY